MIPDDILIGCCVGTMYPDGTAAVAPWCAHCGHGEPGGWAWSCLSDNILILGLMAACGWSYWLEAGFLCPACTRERAKWLTGWED